MDETKTCIGESDKNEQKQEQNTEAKTNLIIKMEKKTKVHLVKYAITKTMIK